MGLTRINTLQPLLGGDPAYNAALLRQLLSEDTRTPASEMLCLNAGAALFASERVDSLREGVRLAQAVLREGKAGRKLDEVIACMQN
jgi:anthranilate phosphoribosyltransferase